MKHIMTLRKAIKEKQIYIGKGDIKYKPDYAKIRTQKTFSDERQSFITTDISWQLIELKSGQLAWLGISSTNQCLNLQGKKGAEAARKTLDKISNLWSCKNLNLVAKSISKSDFEGMQDEIKWSLKGSYIGAYDCLKINGDFRYGVYYVNEDGELSRFTLYSKKTEHQRSLSKEIRPIIYLPDDILIDLSTKMLYKDYNDVAKARLQIVVQQLEAGEPVDEIIQELIKIINIL